MPSGPPARAAHPRCAPSGPVAPPPGAGSGPPEPLDALLQRLRARLREQGPERWKAPGAALRRGVPSGEESPCASDGDGAPHPTGIAAIDRLLGGGFPAGRLCELAGPASCGRTSLALAVLAQATRRGHCVGLVDVAHAFDPPSAAAAGVVLERVLWVRPRRSSPHTQRPGATAPAHRLRQADGPARSAANTALRCVERLLETDGFPLLLLDLAHSGAPAPQATGATGDPNAWRRLARACVASRKALLVLAPVRCSGAAAHIALEMQTARARWSGPPVLLEEIEVEVHLTRHRAAPTGRRAALRLGSHAA